MSMKRIFALLLALFILSYLFVGCDNSTLTSGELKIHFIDVGQADAALVLCGDKSMLIDGGNKTDSALIYTYLKKYGISHLDYIIATHPHEDHIGGLSGALNYATVDTVYCSTDVYDSTEFYDFKEYVSRKNAEIKVPQSGDFFMLGEAVVHILSCYSEDGVNNSSIVLRIVYGNTSFLFTGDAEREAEAVILESGAMIESTVLKIGHHGSDTSTSYQFLREIMPKYAVISVGADNEFGHPSEGVLSRLRDADIKVYRTDINGTIICTSDGEKVEFEVYKNTGETSPAYTNEAAATDPSEDKHTYILNINPSSRRFHKPDCKSVQSIKDENKKEFYGTREQAIAEGYVPCGSCKP